MKKKKSQLLHSCSPWSGDGHTVNSQIIDNPQNFATTDVVDRIGLPLRNGLPHECQVVYCVDCCCTNVNDIVNTCNHTGSFTLLTQIQTDIITKSSIKQNIHIKNEKMENSIEEEQINVRKRKSSNEHNDTEMKNVEKDEGIGAQEKEASSGHDSTLR